MQVGGSERNTFALVIFNFLFEQNCFAVALNKFFGEMCFASVLNLKIFTTEFSLKSHSSKSSISWLNLMLGTLDNSVKMFFARENQHGVAMCLLRTVLHFLLQSRPRIGPEIPDCTKLEISPNTNEFIRYGQ